MAAASFWNRVVPSLEDLAKETDGQIVKLQAHARGCITRLRFGAAGIHFRTVRTRRYTPPVVRQHHLNHGKARDTGSLTSGHTTSQLQASSGSTNETKHEALSAGSPGSPNADSGEMRGSRGISQLPHTPVDSLPPGWTVNWDLNGTPHFTSAHDLISTYVHPRQREAHCIYGPLVDLARAWQYHRLSSIVSQELTPTIEQAPSIGVLALESIAKNWERGYQRKDIAKWWTEQPRDEDVLSLCRVCCHINFDALLHRTHPYMYDPFIPLGTIGSVSKNTGCSFCRLVTQIGFINFPPGSGMDLDTRAFISCRLTGDPEWTRSRTRVRMLYVKFSLGHFRATTPLVLGGTHIHEILTPGTRPPEQKYNDNRIVADLVDFKLVREWLRACETDHGSPLLQSAIVNASFEPQNPTSIHDAAAVIYDPCLTQALTHATYDLTVVDVENECLVDVKPDVRYVALSYVWGGDRHFQNTTLRDPDLRIVGGVSLQDTRIPRTIRDALHAVQALGERYLWVDSLCIVQDNVQNKRQQIANMGNIYSRALLTIEALYGTSAEAGLPGVQPGTRKSIQHVEEVQGIRMANVSFHLEDAVQTSCWNVRGWTYQEHELSKRCMVVFNHQVYFQCNRGVWKEDCGMRDVAPRMQRALRVRVQRHPIWNSYERTVNNFTKRSLTLPEDIINAFTGMVSLLQPGFKSGFLFGLPETELDLALLWQPNSAIHRRLDAKTGQPMFSSWSWTGWVGEVKYKWTRHALDDLSRVKWQALNRETGEIGFFTSNEIRAPSTAHHGDWRRVLNSDRSCGYYFESNSPDIWCHHPTAPQEDRLPLQLIQPGSQHLRFECLVAHFRISTIHCIDHHDSIASCKTDGHILCPFHILDRDGFVAGTIYVPGHMVPRIQQEPITREFLCLSRRRGDWRESNYHDVYEHLQDYKIYPTIEDDIKDISDRVMLYPNQLGIDRQHDKYDHSRYNKNKPWPLYNIMIIERKTGVAFRLALGIIHVTAFIRAKPTWQPIVLE